METIFSTNGPAEDLMSWAIKLRTLGRMVSELADNGSNILECEGDTIGCIIVDYADAIHMVAEKAYHPIDKFFNEGGGTLVHDLQKELKNVREIPIKKFAIERINKIILEKIEPALPETEALCDLYRDFTEMRNTISQQQ